MPDFLSYTYLVPLFPLLAFAAIIFFTNSNKKLSSFIAIGAIALSWLWSWGIVAQVISTPHFEHSKRIFIAWAATGRLSFEVGVVVDGLTAAMLFMVPFVCMLIFIYAQGYMNPPDLHTDPLYSRFFAYISLFAFGMLLLVVSDNLFTLFLAWEIMGLCSYLLIGFWFHKPSAMNAAKKAFLTTRVGDVLFFLGMLLLYSYTNTLTFEDIFKEELLHRLAHTMFWGLPLTTVIALLIFGGAIGKSAQFPLHVWLPDAMEGPTPVSALIHAATMVAAGVYLVARMLPVFNAGADHNPLALTTVALIGAITALGASTIAVAQNDIKRVLAYSTVSQLGYMVMALGIGGYIAAIFHLLTHAFFKALLFLGSGSVIIGMERGHHLAAAAHGGHDAPSAHQADEHDAHQAADAHAFDPNDMMNMGGLGKRMPHTTWTFFVGALALAGIFPLAGFWSKDEILAHAFEGFALHGEVSLPFWIGVIGLLAALMTAFYTGRQLGLTFLGQPRHEAAEKAKESPATMTVPLMVLAVFTVILGVMNLPETIAGIHLPGAGFLHHLIGETFKAAHLEFHATAFNLTLAVGSTILALGSLVAGIFLYRNMPAGAADPLASMPFYHVLKNKYYMDELYGYLIRTFIVDPHKALQANNSLTGLSGRFDRNIIDGTVNTIGEAARELAMDLKDYFDTLVIEGLVNGSGKLSLRFGQWLRGIQTGRAQNYLLVVTLALIALAGYRIIGNNWEMLLFGAGTLALVGYGAYIFSKATK